MRRDRNARSIWDENLKPKLANDQTHATSLPVT